MVLVPILVGALLASSAANPQNAPAPRAPDFKLSASPDGIAVRRGETGRVTVTIEPLSGFNGRVDLLSSLLYATSTTLSPQAVENGAGTAVLSISPSAEAIKGSYMVSITGTCDGIAHSITVTITVK